MKLRPILAMLFSWGMCVLSACMAVPSAAVADGPPASCQETTERVLKPFLDRVAATEEAARQYEEQNAKQIASIALERIVYNEPNIGEILDNVDYGRLRQSLSLVEDRIAALPPSHADEARLLRMRETFRILIRAKQQEA